MIAEPRHKGLLICYHEQFGPIQTFDTCMVVVNGNLVRACATLVEPGMIVLISNAANVGHCPPGKSKSTLQSTGLAWRYPFRYDAI